MKITILTVLYGNTNLLELLLHEQSTSLHTNAHQTVLETTDRRTHETNGMLARLAWPRGQLAPTSGKENAAKLELSVYSGAAVSHSRGVEWNGTHRGDMRRLACACQPRAVTAERNRATETLVRDRETGQSGTEYVLGALDSFNYSIKQKSE